MAMPKQLNGRIHIIDGMDLGLKERTGTYVIDEQELTIIDTSASPSVQHVKKGLKELGFSLDQVKYIIVTHVHLDHAGGAGLLLKDCPNAKIVVHPKGARHLADPSRLIAGARMVYGEKFDELFNPIIPVPEDRLLLKTEGGQLQISPACTLEFWDTPGHANHHFGIYDPVSNGMFAGDTAGIRYEQLVEDGIELFLPSTSPNQFDPVAMKRAIDRMLAQNLDAIYYGHYGMTEKPQSALHQVSDWLEVFLEEAKAALDSGDGPKELAARLKGRVKEHLRQQHIADDHPVYKIIQLDMEVSSMGMMDFLAKNKSSENTATQ
ncbi:MBL fold metallo-hydrolase [Planococcus shenhongbingii]|nr:MBL fold metallo-hydrolase [Planococcus sp. N016]WKA56879.1 MBL fold metallo-hydrolase [Planococcus sp. N016]